MNAYLQLKTIHNRERHHVNICENNKEMLF